MATQIAHFIAGKTSNGAAARHGDGFVMRPGGGFGAPTEKLRFGQS